MVTAQEDERARARPNTGGRTAGGPEKYLPIGTPPARAWRPGVGWLTAVAVLAAIAINLAGIGAIAVAQRGVIEEARRLLRLEAEARAGALESVLASTRADLAFLTGSPIFFGLESALVSRDPRRGASSGPQSCGRESGARLRPARPGRRAPGRGEWRQGRGRRGGCRDRRDERGRRAPVHRGVGPHRELVGPVSVAPSLLAKPRTRGSAGRAAVGALPHDAPLECGGHEPGAPARHVRGQGGAAAPGAGSGGPRGDPRARSRAPAVPHRAAEHGRPARSRDGARDQQPAGRDVELSRPGSGGPGEGRRAFGGPATGDGPGRAAARRRHRATGPATCRPCDGPPRRPRPQRRPPAVGRIRSLTPGIPLDPLRAGPRARAARRAGEPGASGPGVPEPDPQRLRSAAGGGRGAGHDAPRRRAGGGRIRRPRSRGARGGERAHLRAVLLHQGIDRARPVDLLLDRDAAWRRARRAGPRGWRGHLPDPLPGGRGARCLRRERERTCLRKSRRGAGSWSWKTRRTSVPPWVSSWVSEASTSTCRGASPTPSLRCPAGPWTWCSPTSGCRGATGSIWSRRCRLPTRTSRS